MKRVRHKIIGKLSKGFRHRTCFAQSIVHDPDVLILDEPTDGLSFEKFQNTLRKNRDALVQRHNCKRVRFSVYIKDGRASLKATPVKE